MAESPVFKKWHRFETAKRLGQPSIESIVEKELSSENVRIEVKGEHGRWISLKEED